MNSEIHKSYFESLEKFNSEADKYEGKLVKLIAEFVEPKNKKVLIVDDEESNQTVLSSILREFKYVPFSVRNGEEALKFLENNDVYAALVDNNMPVMTGEEFIYFLRKREARKIRRNRNFKPSYLIAMGQGLSKKALEMCNAEISKPIDMHELLYVLDKRTRLHKKNSKVYSQ